MVQIIRMPMMGNTMEIGVLVEWSVTEGETVTEEDPIATVESEKATNVITAKQDGELARIDVEEGTEVPPGTVLGILLGPDEDLSDAPDPEEDIDAGGDQTAEATDTAVDPESEASGPTDGGEKDAPEANQVAESSETTTSGDSGHTFASPNTRRLARSLGVSIESVEGSGQSGRVTAGDVRAAAEDTNPTPAPTSVARDESQGSKTDADSVNVTVREEQELGSMRRTIAERMVHSSQTIPQVTLSRTVPVGEALRVVSELSENDEQESANEQITVTDVIVAALARTLREYPRFNAWFEAGELRLIEDINVGIAVDLDDGLVAPTIRNAGQRSVRDLARERQRVQQQALKGDFTMAALQSGTFTVTNLGMFGVESFDPLINPPQVAILGVGVIEDSVCPLDLTFDHRVVDGADAAQFLDTLVTWIETPTKLVMEHDHGARTDSPPAQPEPETAGEPLESSMTAIERSISEEISETATAISAHHSWPISDLDIDVTLQNPPEFDVKYWGDASPALVRRAIYAACRESQYADIIDSFRDPALTLVEG